MGAKERAKGKYEELKGKGKEAIGDVRDDEELQAEGKVDEVKGKGRQAKEDVKEAGRDLKRRAEDLMD